MFPLTRATYFGVALFLTHPRSTAGQGEAAEEGLGTWERPAIFQGFVGCFPLLKAAPCGGGGHGSPCVMVVVGKHFAHFACCGLVVDISNR